VLSQQQALLLEVAALGLMRAAGAAGCAGQPRVCADAAVAAMLQIKPTPVPTAASSEDTMQSMPYIMQQTLSCLSSLPSRPPPAINLVAPLPDGSIHLPSVLADYSDPLLLIACPRSGPAHLADSFIASVSRCKYVMGGSICYGQDGTAAVYMLDVGLRVHMDDVFLAARGLSRDLDSCYADDDDSGDDDGGSATCPLGFFMSPTFAVDSSLPPSRVASSSLPSSSTYQAAHDFSSASCLSIHCIGLQPLRSPLVQLALHALLHGTMPNLVSLSLRLLPTSLILPELHHSLSRLACLQHLDLRFDRCSSSDSASMIHAVACLPLLCSLQLQGLDLSSLLLPSACVIMAAPITNIVFRDVVPPLAAAVGDGSGVTSCAAATMPLGHIACVLHSCTSTLQSLTISGKQDVPIEQQAGSWRLLCHAIAPCMLLHTLDVSKSGIDAVRCVGLAHCLQRLVLLLKLDVSGNPLAAARVAPGVRDMTNVGAGVLMLASALKGLTGLTSLLIKKCCINRSGAVALLQALHAHTSLTHLAIGGNEYSGLPHAVHELVVIKEGISCMTCALDSAIDYDAMQGHAEAIRAVCSGGESLGQSLEALRAALVPVGMCALADQILQPGLHHPPAALPRLLLGVISKNSALISLHLADLCLPLDALQLLAAAWQQLAVPPITFGDFRCRVEASTGQARQVAVAWATVVQAAVASYESRGRKMPLTLCWPSFQ
jgi:hypothetical protein